ncbi:MAG: hypothetical protein IKR04_05145 [Clostridia bacterium]|nr:hypothetical protein [Clostridia bacterium]
MADIEKIQPMGDSTQYTLRARTDSDGNVIVNKYVTLDTSQTISGGKAFTSSVTIRNNGRWPYLEYKPITSSTTTCMVIWGGTDESGNITDSTLEFRLMSPSSTLNTNIGDHFEGYKLPSVNKDRTTDIWYNILTEKNYNDYTPTKTGGGASGTWGINITGNAATATKLSNTPNRTDYFLRGDNNWSNAVTGYINSYGLWAD